MENTSSIFVSDTTKDCVIANIYTNKRDNRVYNVEVRMGKKVLTLNGKPLPGTIDKSAEFYDGYVQGFEHSALIVTDGKPEEFNIKVS